MPQLVAEYRALRLWFDAELPRREAVEDIGRFNEAIDQAVAESVEFFSREVDRWRNVFLGLPASLAPCDLAAVCQEEVKVQKAALPGCRIEYRTGGATQGSWDASRIRQVVGNLITNAARYGNQASPVGVKLCGGEADVRLSMENEGPTMPPEAVEVLFEPLRRAANSHAKAERISMGLGLFIVRQVAQAHGATVSVDSADGRTVFTVMLPRAPRHAG
jgi:signal transduction histidine kinase